jgi:hypothetical protein
MISPQRCKVGSRHTPRSPSVYLISPSVPPVISRHIFFGVPLVLIVLQSAASKRAPSGSNSIKPRVAKQLERIFPMLWLDQHGMAQ